MTARTDGATAADRDDDELDGAQSGRWLISYADLITTLMVLFLALYVLQLAKYNALDAKILFNVGDARLLPDSSPVLNQIAQALSAHAMGDILVEGHTDSVPIANAKYESNWELSSARAGSVVRYLTECGVAPHRLAAIGRADTQPLVTGDDAAARARNRRVTIFVAY
ncbi:OmpA/MotB family protein [Burkholderia theae]|uniref:OmpA/MotB family protein n=1 Tax=Burkholderia theae TaxID=3143496 RepID=UPI003AFAEFDB